MMHMYYNNQRSTWHLSTGKGQYSDRKMESSPLCGMSKKSDSEHSLSDAFV